MMQRFATFGNDLYTGRRSIDFVGRLRRWAIISVVIFVVVGLGLAIRGLNLGIEFTGGSDFRVTGVSDTSGAVDKATDVVRSAESDASTTVTLIGGDTVRVQTDQLDERLTQDVSAGLAKAFGVSADNVGASVIGPSWGASVSQKALQALVWFLVLVSLVLAFYFRTWKMAFAALVALFHDIFITVGVYALAGFEVTPASMIGFLTILGYSLYDTVVVFDKVRENTTEAVATGRMTYSQAANLAVNQTLVRSINTSVVALLPVAAILVVGLTVLGPGTLLDLSLALFIGIAVGTYSSIFVATPLLAWLREREPVMKELRARVERREATTGGRSGVLVGAPAGGAAASGDASSTGGSSVALRPAVRPAGQPAAPVSAAGAVFGAGVTGLISTGSGPARPVGAVSDLREHESDDATAEQGQGDADYTLTGRPVHPSLRPAPSAGDGKRRRRAKS